MIKRATHQPMKERKHQMKYDAAWETYESNSYEIERYYGSRKSVMYQSQYSGSNSEETIEHHISHYGLRF